MTLKKYVVFLLSQPFEEKNLDDKNVGVKPVSL